MGFGNIRNTSSNYDNAGNYEGSDSNFITSQGVTDIIFQIKKKKTKVTQEHIKKIAKGVARVAYSMGETNDEEGYAEWLAEDITEALKKVKRNRDKDKKKKK